MTTTIYIASKFLSTLSLRRATLLSIRNTHNFDISIHALLAESDSKRFGNTLEHLHFYPRSPCGERLDFPVSGFTASPISIHALLAESDLAPLS